MNMRVETVENAWTSWQCLSLKKDFRVAKRFKLVLVEWVDSCRLNNGWMDMADIPEPYPHKCVTVGFQIAKNKRGIVLVPTIGDTEHPENSHTYGGMMIPRSAIVRSEVLR